MASRISTRVSVLGTGIRPSSEQDLATLLRRWMIASKAQRRWFLRFILGSETRTFVASAPDGGILQSFEQDKANPLDFICCDMLRITARRAAGLGYPLSPLPYRKKEYVKLCLLGFVTPESKRERQEKTMAHNYVAPAFDHVGYALSYSLRGVDTTPTRATKYPGNLPELLAVFNAMSRRQQKRVVNYLTCSSDRAPDWVARRSDMVRWLGHNPDDWASLSHSKRKALLVLAGIVVNAPRREPLTGARGRKA